MNECYNFQNSTGFDIGDIIDRDGIINLIDISSNNNYSFTSNITDELKQKDISHDASISSINTNIGSINSTLGTLGTITTLHSEQISLLQATDIALGGSIATNTGAIAGLVLNKLDKTSLDGISVIYRDNAGNVQLKYDNDAFKEVSIITGNTRLFTLQDTCKTHQQL